MSRRLRIALVLFALLNVCSRLADAQAHNDAVHRRFVYKSSFRAPNLAQRDGSIPFWVIAGDAIASSEQLRLAPSIRSRKGIAWNKRPFAESDNFEVDFAFKVSGQRIGADGLALWYTANQGTLGPVFGANDYWHGLALMFDSFDNDGQRNNPYISVMINDGTRSYSHQTDGSSQILGGCQRDYRNKPYPTRARVQYLNNVLTVEISDGLTPQPRYEPCIRAENVFLPQKGYFGVSAATGGLADDHDVTDFSVYSLSTQAQRAANAIPQDERTKYDAEFEKQMQEFEEERKRFKQQHPEKAKDDEEDDPSRYYEDIQARELRLIHESQAQIYTILQQMDGKLAQLQQGGGAVQSGGGQAPPVAAGGFQQHEKGEVIQSLRDLTASLRDMKSYVNEIYTRSHNIEQRMGQIGGGAPVAASAGQAGVDATVRAYLDGIQNEVRQIRSSQLAQGGGSAGAAVGCPELACTSPTIFFVVILIQSAVILTFVFLRSKQDKAKFY
ncbi:ERGIC-53-like protein [Aphelenchoides fujianensis]|nr:ERGIC-53-like protein [Aphelenchoides fujianensis]